MGRSGYGEDINQWQLIRWRGAVASAIRGKRGQAFLREMAAALDSMPKKELIAKELEQEGHVCALGSLGKARGINLSNVEPTDHEAVAELFGITHALACEVMYENDEGEYWRQEQPEDRWQRMRYWIQKHIKGNDALAVEGKRPEQ